MEHRRELDAEELEECISAARQQEDYAMQACGYRDLGVQDRGSGLSVFFGEEGGGGFWMDFVSGIRAAPGADAYLRRGHAE